MRRLLALLLALLLIPGLALADHSVRYFYENYCEACNPDEDFAEEFRQLTGMALGDCDYAGYNVVRQTGKAALADMLTQLGLETARMPLIVVDGVAYQGAAELNAGLPEAALSWGATIESAVVYLYTPACESCARAAAVLAGLPDNVTVKRGVLTFDSPVTVTRYDASANVALADALFESYAVPDEKRVTPIVFFADRYLSGADAIEKNLSGMVGLGWAVGGVHIDTNGEAAAPEALELSVTIMSGLVAGFNTCALSMLLLFLSILMETKRHTIACAVCYLLAKFVCYLLIGFALLGVLQQFNPAWLKPAARIVLTAIGLVLTGLNLWDAWQVQRLAYGKVRNQLPAGLRGGLQQVIQRLTHSAVLIPAVILLGFVVALGEFLCAGQLYLMRLLNAVQTGSAATAFQLSVYCLAFVAPSALLSVLVLGGRSHLRFSTFFARHMAAAKLITAAAMLVLILTAWLI